MLGKKLLNYRLNKLVTKDRALYSVAYSDAKIVGILYTAEDLKKHEAVKQLVKNLTNDDKKVEVLSMLPEGIQNFEFKFNFFSEKDLSFFGKITSADVHAFAGKPFDYLFYLDFESLPIMRYILAMSKAKCRIGYFEEENRPVCELMVAPELTTYNSLIKEMYKYTQILT